MKVIMNTSIPQSIPAIKMSILSDDSFGNTERVPQYNQIKLFALMNAEEEKYITHLLSVSSPQYQHIPDDRLLVFHRGNHCY